MQQLIIATGNAHKVEEFSGLLAGLGLRVDSAAVCGGMPPVEETGENFGANARLKAEALLLTAPPDAWVLADDSGLEVDFLRGAPGIYSARYAGPEATDRENVEKLLWTMRDVPASQRAARFRCVLCLARAGHEARFFDGTCEGRIADAPSGGAGFGYDPVFIPEGHGRSFGELGEAAKARLSHRARAVEVFRAWVAAGE